jgi:hypothetical protein
MVNEQKVLESEVFTDFEKMVKAQEDISIIKNLEVIQTYPSFCLVEEGKNIADPVLLPKVLSTIKGFSNSKSLGPHGRRNQFFSGIF